MLIEICRALRTGQLVPAQPSGDEVAWLIERDDLRTAESGDRVCLHYYAESRPGRHYWTPDHLKAKRFPTRESALAECNNDPLLRVCEHMWMGSQPSGDVVEAVARAIHGAKMPGHNPDCLYEHHDYEPWPVDDRREYADPFTGKPRVQLFHKAWRRYESAATAAITALDAVRGKQ